MKKCPFCAEDIQDEAKVCRYCNRELQPTAGATSVAAASAPKKQSAAVGCLGILAALFFVGWCANTLNPTPTPPASSADPAASPRRPPRTPAGPVLEILSKSGYESSGGGYMVVEGQIKNITDAPLKSIQVVASWFDASGNFVTSDSALIEYDPLMPGQTSPFKTMSRGNPLMKRFSVEFKPIFGTALKTKDSSPK